MRLDDPHGASDESLPGLHPALRDRHTSRYPFSERQIPENVRAALAEAAAREGAQLSFLTSPHRETVLDLIMHAEGYNRMEPGREAEQRRWTHDTAAEPAVDDGIPDYAFGPRDTPADWLRAGQALERVLLAATLQGIASSFATQPVEWPDLRWILRDPVSGSGHVHMILRLGYGPQGARTPRRPVDQVLTITP